ncbi:MAG: hypothetical protein LBB47_01480, partial [Spirochaetaceae bacterium]|nr:hypothetical protein [Spirochaetaceae bacterium]
MNDRKERLIIKLIKYFPRKIKRKLTGYLEDNVNSQTTRISELRYQMNALTCMFARMMTKDNNFQFYGQVNQDLFAYLFFNGKKDGFYIDIGANDGITM